MPTTPHRVTAQHIHGLAASVSMRSDATILALTDDGLQYVSAGQVFAEASTVRRILMTADDLIEDIQASGVSASAFLKANAARIAAELNAVLIDNS